MGFSCVMHMKLYFINPRTRHYNPSEMYLSIGSLKIQGKLDQQNRKAGRVVRKDG